LLSKIEKIYDVKIQLADIFKNSIIGDMAMVIKNYR